MGFARFIATFVPLRLTEEEALRETARLAELQGIEVSVPTDGNITMILDFDQGRFCSIVPLEDQVSHRSLLLALRDYFNLEGFQLVEEVSSMGAADE